MDTMTVRERGIALFIAAVLTVACGTAASRSMHVHAATRVDVAAPIMATTTVTTETPTTQPSASDTTTTIPPAPRTTTQPPTRKSPTPTTVWKAGDYPLSDVPPGQMVTPGPSPFDGFTQSITVTPGADPLTVDATIEFTSPQPLVIISLGVCWGDHGGLCDTHLIDGPTLSCPHFDGGGGNYRYVAHTSHTYQEAGTYRVEAGGGVAPGCDAPAALWLMFGPFTDVSI